MGVALAVLVAIVMVLVGWGGELEGAAIGGGHENDSRLFYTCKNSIELGFRKRR